MFPNINPKKIAGMMKKMGIGQEEVEASRVIIEKKDGKIVIENPNVVKISMSGQESFQITGDVREEQGESEIEIKEKKEEDIKTIMEKTGADRKKAEKALDETGDLAEAILKLSD